MSKPMSPWLVELLKVLEERDEKRDSISLEEVAKLADGWPAVEPGETVAGQVDPDLRKLFGWQKKRTRKTKKPKISPAKRPPRPLGVPAEAMPSQRCFERRSGCSSTNGSTSGQRSI